MIYLVADANAAESKGKCSNTSAGLRAKTQTHF